MHGFHVGVALAAVVGGVAAPLVPQLFIQKPLAGEVVVQAHHVGWARVVEPSLQFFFAGAVLAQAVPELMRGRDMAAQQIKAEPAAQVFEISLVAHGRRAVHLGQVFGLHQLGVRNDFPDGLRRQPRSFELVEQGPDEGAVVGGVRIPVAVKGAKTGSGQRLVHGSEVREPGVALGYIGRVLGEAGSECVFVQGRVAEAAAVVHQANNGVDS